MKLLKGLLAIALVSLIAVSCKEAKEKADDVKAATEEVATDVKEGAEEAVEEVKEGAEKVLEDAAAKVE